MRYDVKPCNGRCWRTVRRLRRCARLDAAPGRAHHSCTARFTQSDKVRCSFQSLHLHWAYAGLSRIRIIVVQILDNSSFRDLFG